MIPQERDLLTNLVNRLRQSAPPAKDAEADGMIADLVRERPDVPYVLAQTVLIQDYALHQAQARIAELEQQAQGAQPDQGGGFLGAIFGSGKAPQAAPISNCWRNPRIRVRSFQVESNWNVNLALLQIVRD